jgi:hypothetical protein
MIKTHNSILEKSAQIITPPNREETPQQPDWNAACEFFGSPKATEYFGKEFARKMAALAWTKSPERFGGKTLPAVANELGVSKQVLYKHAARARRVFGK